MSGRFQPLPPEGHSWSELSNSDQDAVMVRFYNSNRSYQIRIFHIYALLLISYALVSICQPGHMTSIACLSCPSVVLHEVSSTFWVIFFFSKSITSLFVHVAYIIITFCLLFIVLNACIFPTKTNCLCIILDNKCF